MTTHIELEGDVCSRCKKATTLRPFKLTEYIIYRRKAIKHPWLCLKCFLIEKEKAWKQFYAMYKSTKPPERVKP